MVKWIYTALGNVHKTSAPSEGEGILTKRQHIGGSGFQKQGVLVFTISTHFVRNRWRKH